jgi:hypothetical protein
MKISTDEKNIIRISKLTNAHESEKMKGRLLTGKIGEHLVMIELLKNRIDGIILGENNLLGVSDIITSYGINIEVKSSIYKEHLKKSGNIYKAGWGFNALHRSNATFIVLCLLEKDFSLYRMLTYKKYDLKSDSFFYLRPSEVNLNTGNRGPQQRESIIDEVHNGIDIIVKEYIKNAAISKF